MPVALRKKLGLALSGGGFRASLFHVGVLARLADCGLLRHVEVISTVSGGSIIAALYYLNLKMLLESKADSDITDVDYQELVATLQADFLTAVQKNIRLLTFVNPIKNLRMSHPDYSRSDRIGELFDDLLYRPVFGPGRTARVLMRELLIRPDREGEEFHPESHNDGRAAKVPILLLNATTLNTGRNWRFEAVRMGEPPRNSEIARDVDKRMRLIRPDSYEHITPNSKDLALGQAVAASAAVPGLFHPLAISRLYKDIRVELVDGGVHDNQGVQGLLDRDCTQFVVSDGSGQMDGERNPGTSLLSVLLRSNGILMSRVREEQIFRLDAPPMEKRPVCFLHLRKGLQPEYVPYINADGRLVDMPRQAPDQTLAKYDTAPDVQSSLSKVRTDLDAFNDAEAYSLMLNGYKMAAHELRLERDIWHRKGQIRRHDWSFDQVVDLLKQPTKPYQRVLDVASSTVFKVFSLYKPLAVGATLLALLSLITLAWLLRSYLLEPVIPYTYVPSWMGLIGVTLGASFLAYSGTRRLFLTGLRLRRVVKWVRHPVFWVGRLCFRGLPPVLGSLFIYAYLKLLNPLYLRAGRLSRLQRISETAGAPRPRQRRRSGQSGREVS